MLHPGDHNERSMTTGIVIATRIEAEPFIQGLDLKEIDVRPFRVYTGNDVCLAISGIGKVNAAIATAYMCQKFDPACIINLGAAGATVDSRDLGQIFLIEKTIEPDRIHLRTNTPYIQHPDLLDGFETAVLATQDRAVIDADVFRIMAPAADLVDMEGAAVVQASQRFNKKCLIFKFVSDMPAHAGQEELILRQIKFFRGPFCDFILNSVTPVINHAFLTSF
jgi:adenosylhomocysteine nucleosidase